MIFRPGIGNWFLEDRAHSFALFDQLDDPHLSVKINTREASVLFFLQIFT